MKENSDNFEKFEDTEEMLGNILNNLMDLIIVLDLKGNFLYVSPQIYEISGFKQEEVIGKSGFKFMHPDDITKAAIALKEGIEQKKKVHIEYRTIHKDGYYVEVVASGRIVEMGGEKRVFAIVKNISEQIKAERRFRSIFNSIPIGLHVYKLNTEGQLVFIDANPPADRILNVDNKQFIGKTIEEAFPPLINTDIPKRYKKIAKDGGTWSWDQVDYENDKIQGAYEVLAFQTNPGFMITSFHDITGRIEAENKIRESEKKYRLLIEDSLEGVWVIDEYAYTTLVNSSMAKLLGYKSEEMIGKNLFDFTLPEDLENTKNTLNRRKKGVKEEIEKRFIRKDGTEVETRLLASPIFEGNDTYKGAIAFVSDITERKISEEKLKESEEKFRNIAEQSFMGILVIQDGLFKYFNEKATQTNGYSIDEIRNWKSNEFGKIIHPEDRDFVMEQAAKKQTGDPNVVNNYQTRIIRKDGEIRWLDIFSKTINYEGSTADLVVNIDITDKIEAEQRLRESEEKFRTLFEIAPASITMLDLNGNIIINNQKFRDLHGMQNPEFLEGRNIRDFFSKSDLPKLKESIKLSLEGKPRGLNTYTMLKEDGTEFLAEAISSGIKDKNGEVIGLIGVAQDITDREKAAQELRESEEKFRTIAEQSFMGVLIIQEDKVEYVNKALLDIFEFSENDIENWSKLDLTKLIDKEDLQYLRDYRNKLRQEEPNIKPYYSYKVFTKSGKKKWIDQFSKEINFKGRPAELVTIMDITEKKEAEQELVKLNSLKSELMRRTSHELKTPLVSIKGYADLLLSVHKENLDDYVLASVVEIKQGCERLESLIQDILNTAELESGAVQIKKVEEDLSFFIKLSVRELRGLARLRNITVTSKIKNKLTTSFEPEQLHQVISNLINNAIKYTPPDGTIEIESEVNDGYITVSVKDSGIGITEEEKDRLFTQFGKIERYGQGLDIISEGSGLGLYISKKVIELHGGKIWVESQGRNKGSTFHFSLPIIRESIQ